MASEQAFGHIEERPGGLSHKPNSASILYHFIGFLEGSDGHRSREQLPAAQHDESSCARRGSSELLEGLRGLHVSPVAPADEVFFTIVGPQQSSVCLG